LRSLSQVSEVEVRGSQMLQLFPDDQTVAARGAGFDVIGYSPTLGHVYLAGTPCHCLVILGVNSQGQLSFLDRFEARLRATGTSMLQAGQPQWSSSTALVARA
jgi:hypothetical protein